MRSSKCHLCLRQGHDRSFALAAEEGYEVHVVADGVSSSRWLDRAVGLQVLFCQHLQIVQVKLYNCKNPDNFLLL